MIQMVDRPNTTPSSQDRRTLTLKALLYLNVAVYVHACGLFCALYCMPLISLFCIKAGEDLYRSLVVEADFLRLGTDGRYSVTNGNVLLHGFFVYLERHFPLNLVSREYFPKGYLDNLCHVICRLCNVFGKCNFLKSWFSEVLRLCL